MALLLKCSKYEHIMKDCSKKPVYLSLKFGKAADNNFKKMHKHRAVYSRIICTYILSLLYNFRIN